MGSSGTVSLSSSGSIPSYFLFIMVINNPIILLAELHFSQSELMILPKLVLHAGVE